MVFRILKPYLRSRAMGFLHEKNVPEKMEALVQKKLQMLSVCNLGKKLGADENPIKKLPLTGYEYYTPFYKNPTEGDFMYPMSEYVRTYTSGTMGKPKVYLASRSGIKEDLKRAGLSLFFICTHDGEKSRLEIGDTIYANLPGGNFLAAFMGDSFKKNQSSILRLVPENSNEMSFQDKVEYFIKSYRDVDIAYMTVTTLMDEIVPKINDQVYLKGFITQDISANPLKEDIKRVTGNYPKTLYASTETLLTGLPSIEYPGAFFLDWRTIYPEFVAEEDALDSNTAMVEDPPEILSMMDLQVGKRYQFIATPLYTDVTRYVMPDIFECIAQGDEVLGCSIPIFRYYTRSDKLVVLHNFTRISEEEMLMILKNAEVPFVDFTIRIDPEGAKEFMHIYLELSQPVEHDELYNKVNASLLQFDKDWRDLVNYLKYNPLKITTLSKDSFKKFLRRKEGMARVARIGMTDEQFKLLIS